MAKKKKKVKKKKISTMSTPAEVLKDPTIAIDTKYVLVKRNDKTTLEMTQDLYNRASKQIGMTDEMIASYPNAESLKKACDGMSPKTNPDARPKEGTVPPPKVYEENMPDKFEIDSKLECKFVLQNRVQFDEATLQTELRRINRKYRVQKPVKIVKTVTFKPVNGKNKENQNVKHLVTHFEIFMKGK